MATSGRMPTLFIPHGGGPCFFMEWTLGPRDTWDRLADWLRSVPSLLPAPPTALVVVSGHWEASPVQVNAGKAPPLLFDYSGFPPHTYELTWPAPGSPELAERVRGLLSRAGIESRANAQRGFDHGVFVPLKVVFPEARIPTVQLSLQAGLDPAIHQRMGQALEPLRDEGVLIIGSGMSFHNLRTYMTPRGHEDSLRFGAWLAKAVAADPEERTRLLSDWQSAPSARGAHPREEHLLPLMVAAGAAGQDHGRVVFEDEVMATHLSAIRFG